MPQSQGADQPQLDQILKKIHMLTDKEEIVSLVHRLAATLDGRCFGELSQFFTEDAVLTNPDVVAHGLTAIAIQAAKYHEDSTRSQHHATGVTVDLDGDRAVARANSVVIVFADNRGSSDEMWPIVVRTIGAVNRYQLVRTEHGWRFDAVTITLV